MRIAIYSDNFYPEISGISDSIITLGKSLAGRGHEIHYFAPRYSKKNFAAGKIPYHELDLSKNITIHRFWSLPFPGPTQQGRLVIPSGLGWLMLKKIKPDVIHTQDFFGVGLEALAAAKFLKVPLVGTSHTPMTEFTCYSPVRSKTVDKIILKYVAWYYNQCLFVSAPSHGVLDEMKQYGFVRPCQPISNPLDVTNYFPVEAAKRAELKKQFKLPEFNLLYTGRIASEKHIDVIIRALDIVRKQIPDIKFALTGHGQAVVELENLISELGLKDHVNFFGRLYHKTLSQLYQASNLFVITSTAETQSLSMMKAMATALPVIGVRARGLADYIKDGENGFLIEPGDVQALADKIVYLYQHPEIGAKLGQGGRQLVESLSVEKITNIWEKLYAQVISDYKK